MRIIAGQARGRKLLSVSEKQPVKPITDRMKQSLFDTIRPLVTGSYFLDLFAGTGSVGLEALSRGAQLAVFADLNPVCLKVITKNCELLKFSERAKITKADVLKPLKRLLFYTGDEGYDIIFAGPPYRELPSNKMLALTEPLLQNIADSGLLHPQRGIIIVQHHKTEEFKVPKELEIYRTAKYGDTLMSYFKQVKNNAA